MQYPYLSPGTSEYPHTHLGRNGWIDAKVEELPLATHQPAEHFPSQDSLFKKCCKIQVIPFGFELQLVSDPFPSEKEQFPTISLRIGVLCIGPRDVLDNIIVEYKPSSVLVIGCHVGYCLLRILQKLPENATVLVIEPKEDFIVLTKKLLSLVGWNDKVVFLSGRPTSDVIKNIRSNYGVQYFDFIFLNRTNHGEPSHVSLLKLLEGDPEKKNGYFCTSQLEPQRQSVILADKVVLLGDVPFLKYVRQSGKYESKYFQLYLEHCPQEIIDGMEMAIFTG
ncbi:unnamed protein product [Clavelina lepadiformis]|uniref:catechol O-methyltransferase n=1 Tax=Clavelina lepadiformis TaxID=159417 RepID=A0ABP0FBD5_CLALP